MSANEILSFNVTHSLVTNNNNTRRMAKYTVINEVKTLPLSASRRNARERNRVKSVNKGFATLRNQILGGALETPLHQQKSTKNLSKTEIVRMAEEYIRSLENVLDSDNKSTVNNTSAMSLTIPPGSIASLCVSRSSSSSTNTYGSQSSPMDDSTTLYADEGIMEAIDW